MRTVKVGVTVLASLILLSIGATLGYWWSSRQFEDVMLLNAVNDATWQVNFLQMIRANHDTEMKDAHKRLLETDCAVLAAGLKQKPAFGSDQSVQMLKRHLAEATAEGSVGASSCIP
jgi:hypothetical protein